MNQGKNPASILLKCSDEREREKGGERDRHLPFFDHLICHWQGPLYHSESEWTVAVYVVLWCFFLFRWAQSSMTHVKHRLRFGSLTIPLFQKIMLLVDFHRDWRFPSSSSPPQNATLWFISLILFPCHRSFQSCGRFITERSVILSVTALSLGICRLQQCKRKQRERLQSSKKFQNK